MSRRYGTFVGLVLDVLNPDVPFWPLESPYHFLKRQKHKSLERKRYLETLWRMQRNGYLKIVEKNSKKFIKLTKKGQLEKLMQKVQVTKQPYWDGKWRVFIFDIPEKSREKRDLLRRLLKHNQFVKLQASVFVSPYALNREAIDYLNESGLKDFVRIMKVEEMDNDKDLQKKFGVLKTRPSV